MTNTGRTGQAIAVMSSKGGVGKTTISLGLAETLACRGAARILLVDADPQGSITGMLELENDSPARERVTLASLLSAALERPGEPILSRNAAFEPLVTSLIGIGGSDVDDAESLDILPVGSGLIELERQFTRRGREAELIDAVGSLLGALRKSYDLILVDCSPGLYLSTESWLCSCDFQIAPIKADRISLTALDLVFDFRRARKHDRISKWLGVVVNCFHNNEEERALLEKIRTFNDLLIFDTVVPASLALQRVSIKQGFKRSYRAKYPGAAGDALTRLGTELLQRTAHKATRAAQLGVNVEA